MSKPDFFFTHIYTMEGKSSIQRSALFLLLLANCPGKISASDDSKFYFFYDQVIEILPRNSTEILNFSNTNEILVFFGKKDGLFFKNGKGGNFAVEYSVEHYFLQISFPCGFFWKKIEKF